MFAVPVMFQFVGPPGGPGRTCHTSTLISGGAPIRSVHPGSIGREGIGFVQATPQGDGATHLPRPGGRRRKGVCGQGGLPRAAPNRRRPGRDVAPGEPGGSSSGPNVFAGYWRKPKETAEARRGWSATRHGAAGTGGFSTHRAQVGDDHLSGGKNLPAAVERAIVPSAVKEGRPGHADPKRARLWGLRSCSRKRDRDGGGDPGRAPGEIAPFKMPKRIFFVTPSEDPGARSSSAFSRSGSGGMMEICWTGEHRGLPRASAGSSRRGHPLRGPWEAAGIVPRWPGGHGRGGIYSA